MKFIHAADIHLDSPLTGLTAYPDAPVEMLRTATRRAFTNLCDEAIALEVDFLVIAGDLYDGSWKDFSTGIFFCKEMGRLNKANIPVFVLYGNHDAASELTRTLHLPDNVKLFDFRKCSTHVLPHLKVALHGHSFKDAATTDNLAAGYPAPVEGMFNIGVLHTALEGNTLHARYAPCTVAELHGKGYDYWALGHVHEFQVIGGESTIVFPGNLQGRNVRETGARGAVLVTRNERSGRDGSSDGHGRCEVSRLLVDVLRWHRLEVDVSGCDDLADIVRATSLQLAALVEDSDPALPNAVRVTLKGRTAAHGELFGAASQVRAEIIALAAAIGSNRLWIEKVRIETDDLDDGQAMAARLDAVADLQAILQAAQTDAGFLKALQTELLGIVGKSPWELHGAVPYFQDIKSGNLGALVAEVRPGLVAHLAKME